MLTDEIKYKIEEYLNTKIIEVKYPPQGMDSQVFFIKDRLDREFAIKYSNTKTDSDIPILKLLEINKIDIPFPKVFGELNFKGRNLLILEKINYPLLETADKESMAKYIPSMVYNLRQIHLVKSTTPGLLSNTKKNITWKEILISMFDGTTMDWTDILKRESLDVDLIGRSLDNIIKVVENIKFDFTEYSLLHTDFNQRNLFIDPNSNQITGIIDWGEAMFGDPIFDFARIRMLVWHFNLGEQVVNNYYSLMNYTEYERKLDDLYWLCRVIQYLGWYSEELNEFNAGRIKLHQDFLKNYNWNL